MTPKERILAALAHKEPDLVPWGEHCIDYNVHEMILGRKSYVHAKFEETRAYWEGRRDEVVRSYTYDVVDLVKALEMDITVVWPVVPRDYCPEPFIRVSEDTWKDGAGGVYRLSSVTGDLYKVPINTAYFQYDITYDEVCAKTEELKNLPPIEPNPDIPEFEAINYAVKELGKTHFLIAPINGLEWPRFGAAEEDSWINLLESPKICEKIAEYQYVETLRQLPRIAASGVDGVLSVGDLGNTTNLYAPPSVYRSIIYKYHRKLYGECKKLGLYVMRHCCGHIWPIIGEICECNDAYEAIQERAGMDIARLKEKAGDRLTLWGGVLHEHIHGGTPEDIEADIRRSFAAAAPGGGFIMGSSHSLTVGATYENIMAMKNGREKYGSYPIKI